MKPNRNPKATLIITCIKCDGTIEGPTRGIRKFLTLHGWTRFESDDAEYFRCFKCGPHKPLINGNR